MYLSVTYRNLLLFFITGLLDITKDPDFTGIYDHMPNELTGDAEMAEERRYFMSKVENLSMRLTLCQNDVLNYKNMYIVE